MDKRNEWLVARLEERLREEENAKEEDLGVRKRMLHGPPSYGSYSSLYEILDILANYRYQRLFDYRSTEQDARFVSDTMCMAFMKEPARAQLV